MRNRHTAPFSCFTHTAAEVAAQLNCSTANVVTATRRAMERIAREVLLGETRITPTAEHIGILVQDHGFQDAVEHALTLRAKRGQTVTHDDAPTPPASG